MTIENNLFMHNLHQSETGKDFRANKTPDDIQQLFRALGYENISQDVADRLSYLSIPAERRNSHFQDALEISEIVDSLVRGRVPEKEINELRMAGLVHDVGKSGPAEATQEEQLAYVTVFNLDFPYGQEIEGVKVNELSLEKALTYKVAEGEISAERAEEILQLLEAASDRQEAVRTETKISRQTTMGTFWSAHVYWTYDILREEALPETLVVTAASHHLLEGHDPAQIGLESTNQNIASLEVADKYQAYRIRLIVADKYQAFRKRSERSHEETVAIMKKRIDDVFKGADDSLIPAKEIYLDVLKIIENNKDLFEKELDLQE